MYLSAGVRNRTTGDSSVVRSPRKRNLRHSIAWEFGTSQTLGAKGARRQLPAPDESVLGIDHLTNLPEPVLQQHVG